MNTPKTEQLQQLLDLKLQLILLRKASKAPLNDDWQKGTKLISNIKSVGDYNVGVLCGTKIDNKYLAVLDMDTRNGGDLDALRKHLKIDEWDDTFIVSTGNYGRHMYYLFDFPVPCMSHKKFFKGIDIKGMRGQVVAPSSIHPDTGNLYYINNNPTYIEVAPKVLQDYMLSKINAPKIKEKVQEIIDIGGRNNYLTAEAGKLKRIGYEGVLLKEMLLQIDKKVCKPPLQDESIKEIDNIIKSSEKWKIVDLSPSLEYEKFKTSKPKLNKPNNFMFHLENCDGFIKRNSINILNSSQRRYPQFAIASSLAILASAAQGSYLAPSLTDLRDDGGNLSLYQICTAPAAAGKNHYLQVVKDVLGEIHSGLLAGTHGSLGGMLTDFFAFNSKISCIDEIQDYFTELSDKRATHKTQILSTIKELFNGLKVIENHITKASVFPSIYNPYYSIFGVGTSAGMNAHLSENIIAGGLLSRFLVWPHVEVSNINFGSSFEISKSDVELLTKIYEVGSMIDFNIDHRSALKLITDYCSGRNKKNTTNIIHSPRFRAMTVLKYSKSALDFMLDFRAETNKKYIETANTGGANSELSHGSLVDRSFQMSAKIASLHALGCRRTTLNIDDVSFAVALVDHLTGCMISNLSLHTAFDPFVVRVIDALKSADSPLTLSQLREATKIRSADKLHKAVLDCVTTHDLATLLMMNKAIVINEAFIKKHPFKLPRGCHVIYKNEKK